MSKYQVCVEHRNIEARYDINKIVDLLNSEGIWKLHDSYGYYTIKICNTQDEADEALTHLNTTVRKCKDTESGADLYDVWLAYWIQTDDFGDWVDDGDWDAKILPVDDGIAFESEPNLIGEYERIGG